LIEGEKPAGITSPKFVASSLELDFRLVFEPGYLALALPKLNVMTVNKPPGLFHGLGIIGTDHFRRVPSVN
jgi:hypothetical protein